MLASAWTKIEMNLALPRSIQQVSRGNGDLMINMILF